MRLENLIHDIRNLRKISPKSFLRKSLIYTTMIPLFLFSSCGGGDEIEELGKNQNSEYFSGKEDSDEDKESPKVYVFSGSDLKKISSYSYENGNLSFSTPQPNLKKGDFVSSKIGDATPYGMLAKITDISQDKTSVKTVPASVDETGEKGKFVFSRSLSPDNLKSTSFGEGVTLKSTSGKWFNFSLEDVVLYDLDGNKNTKNDQLVLNGNLAFSLDIGGEVEVKEDGVYFSTGGLIMNHSHIKVNSTIDEKLNKKFLIKGLDFPPFVAGSIGPVPIIFAPRVEVYVGAKGNFCVGGSMDLTQQALAEGTISYENGWKTHKSFDNQFNFLPPAISSEVNLKGYGGFRTNLLLYGVAGPHLEVNDFGRIETKEKDWRFYGGLEFLAGGNAKRISKKIPEINLVIFESEKLLSEGSFSSGGGLGGGSEEDPDGGSGGKLVFSARKENGSGYQLFSMKSDGSNLKGFNLGVWDVEPFWFPRGDKIIYVSEGYWGDGDLYVVNSDGSGKTPIITSQENRHPTISPKDASGNYYVAYVKDYGIYISDEDGSNPRKITSERKDYNGLHWSQFNEGNEIYFSAPSEKGSHLNDLYKINISTKRVTRITDTPYVPEEDMEDYENKLVFSSINNKGSWGIYISDTQGNNRREVVNMDKVQNYPTWGNKGSKIYFVSKDDIYKVNLDGSNLERLTNFPERMKVNLDYVE